jgi:hypothetical protein
MTVPRGLKTPGRIAELIPVGLALIGVLIAAFFAVLHLVQEAGRSPPMQGVTPSAGAGTAPSQFQPELLFGGGSLVLFLALAYGVWRTQRRNRAKDAITEQATRELYDR